MRKLWRLTGVSKGGGASFYGIRSQEPSQAASSSLSGIRSVAAVAILGAAAAVFSSNLFSEPDRVAERIPDLTNGLTAPVVFIPKDARASVVSAKDHGVVWTKGGQPLRCLEVHVNNKLQFVNERGEKLIIEQPKREVTFTPVKFD
ncbi:hypothetical protein N8488_00460 [Akkermansiaceae bacterium]|nr:hypothetical protein [Akkermansiaceae bacterium]